MKSYPLTKVCQNTHEHPKASFRIFPNKHPGRL